MPSINDLSSAVQKGNAQVVKDLLACEEIKTHLKKHPRSKDDTLLHTAAVRGHVDCVKVLLDSQLFNINATVYESRRHYTPLDFAAKYGRIAVVKLLLDRDANIGGAHEISGETHVWTPLHFAAAYNNIELADLLLSYPNINTNLTVFGDTENSGTPLIFALLNGNFRIAYKILMHQLGFNPLLWLVGLAGIGLIVTGAGALLGWSVMASLLPITSVAIAVTAIGGLLLASSLIYRFGAQLKQSCLNCFKGKHESVDSVSLEPAARNIGNTQLAYRIYMTPDATPYSKLYAHTAHSTVRNPAGRPRCNSM